MRRKAQFDDYFDPPQTFGLGSIGVLSDIPTRKRKGPLGFVKHETKAKPKRRRPK